MLFGSTPNRNRSPALEYQSPFLLSWNIGALASLVLPLLISLIIPRNRREGGEEETNWWNWGGNNNNNGNNQDNNNQDGQSWWQRLFGGDRDDPEQRGMGGGVELFVYFYVIAIFGGLVWYGNRILRRGAFTLPLLASMFYLSNMSFLMTIVLAASVRLITKEPSP